MHLRLLVFESLVVPQDLCVLGRRTFGLVVSQLCGMNQLVGIDEKICAFCIHNVVSNRRALEFICPHDVHCKLFVSFLD